MDQDELSKERVELASKVSHAFRCIAHPIQFWWPYLLAEEFSSHQSLQANIGSIWLCTLYDIEKARAKLAEWRHRAQDLGSYSCLYYTEQLECLCVSNEQLLSNLSEYDTLLLKRYRDMLAHSWLGGVLKALLNVSVPEEGRVVRKPISFERHQSVYDNAAGIMGRVCQALDRAYSIESGVWDICIQLITKKNYKHIISQLKHHDGFTYPPIINWQRKLETDLTFHEVRSRFRQGSLPELERSLSYTRAAPRETS